MKLAYVQKVFLIVLFLTLLGSQLPLMSVHAEDESDKSVADFLDEDKVGDVEKKEIELDKEPSAADRETDGAAVGPSAGDYIRVVIAFVFVIGLLFGLLKFINRKNKLYDKTRLMKNMGGISLGQHKSIQLVVIGETYYIIGVGDDIRLLKEITDPEEIKTLVEFYEGESTETATATGMLNRLLLKMTGKQAADQAGQAEEQTEFSQLFQSRLDEIKEERKRQVNRLTEKERDRNE